MPNGTELTRAVEATLRRLDAECRAFEALEQEQADRRAAHARSILEQRQALEAKLESTREGNDLALRILEREREQEIEAAQEQYDEIRDLWYQVKDRFCDPFVKPLAVQSVQKQLDQWGGETRPQRNLENLLSIIKGSIHRLEEINEDKYATKDIVVGSLGVGFFLAFLFSVMKLGALGLPAIGLVLGFGFWYCRLLPAYLRQQIEASYRQADPLLSAVKRQAYEKERAAADEVKDETASSLQELEAGLARDRAALEEQTRGELERLDAELAEGARRKREELQQTAGELKTQLAELDKTLPLAAWSSPHWKEWRPAKQDEPAVRLGWKTLATPRLDRYFPDLSRVRLPALWSLTEDLPLVLSEGKGAEQALSVLARLLAVQPPGRLRLTLVDPARLGQSAAPLLPLLDLEPALLGGKILSDPQEIERALGELTDHLERVIQRCLRHEFPNVAAYNAQAGEVGEPYRVLVAWDFPRNWTETAVRRLLGIMENGPRCGVQTILVTRSGANLPHGVTWEEIRELGTALG